VYTPDVVAHAILDAAEHPRRDLVVGGMGKVVSLGEKLSPRLTDKYMERSTFDAQLTDVPADADRPTNLYEPLEHDGGERGQFQFRGGRVKKWSAYTEAVLHPRETLGIFASAVAVAAALRVARKARKRKIEQTSSTVETESTPAVTP
jgi:hypothetical protein